MKTNLRIFSEKWSIILAMQKFKQITKRHRFHILGILIIGGIILSGQKLVSQEETITSAQQTSTATAKTGSVIATIEASGQVESANFLAITTSVNGIVKQVFVNEGDTVVKGQKIMEITLNADGEESLAQAWGTYLSAKNSLEKSKTELYAKDTALTNAEEAFEDEKVENSYQTHEERISYALAENSYLTAKESYEQQQATIQQAQVALNKAWLSYQAQSPTIVAPDSGTIANILVVEGMDITNSLSERTSASVASIKKEGNPIVSLNISELDINDIKVGQKVNIELSSIDDQIFTGEVVGIDKIGSVSSGVTNYPVIIRFDQSSELVLPNMGADAQIIIEEKNEVLVVPAAAVSSKNQQAYVTKVENGNEIEVPVEVGISDGVKTEILSGIEVGDEVALATLPTSGFTEAQSQSGTNNFRRPGIF